MNDNRPRLALVAPAPLTEADRFLIEAALWFGFEFTDSAAKELRCTERQLVEFARAVQAGATQS